MNAGPSWIPRQYEFIYLSTCATEKGLVERRGRRIRRKYANTKEEADKFLAEEEGLLDAMLGRNRLDTYGHDHQARRKSYEIGLLDGQILMGLFQSSYGEQSFLNNLKHW